MQQLTAVNNMYAAYTSANVDRKNITELSRLAKNTQDGKEEAIDKDLMMDKVIISKEALQMIRAARTMQ